MPPPACHPAPSIDRTPLSQTCKCQAGAPGTHRRPKRRPQQTLNPNNSQPLHPACRSSRACLSPSAQSSSACPGPMTPAGSASTGGSGARPPARRPAAAAARAQVLASAAVLGSHTQAERLVRRAAAGCRTARGDFVSKERSAQITQPGWFAGSNSPRPSAPSRAGCASTPRSTCRSSNSSGSSRWGF
jgi:hypothetical protein